MLTPHARREMILTEVNKLSYGNTAFRYVSMNRLFAKPKAIFRSITHGFICFGPKLRKVILLHRLLHSISIIREEMNKIYDVVDSI